MNIFLNRFFIFLTEAATQAQAAQETTPGQQFLSALMTFGPIVLIVIAFWFFLIRPQRKQEKETKKMRESIEVGDTVTTIGGITGIVRQIKDDDIFIIETGADKNRISIRKWDIQSKDKVP